MGSGDYVNACENHFLPRGRLTGAWRNRKPAIAIWQTPEPIRLFETPAAGRLFPRAQRGAVEG